MREKKGERFTLQELIGIDLEESDELTQSLLEKEFASRSKQPEAWTKTKYRPYANFKSRKLDGGKKKKLDKRNKAKWSKRMR